jgi:hypothetical protein
MPRVPHHLSLSFTASALMHSFSLEITKIPRRIQTLDNYLAPFRSDAVRWFLLWFEMFHLFYFKFCILLVQDVNSFFVWYFRLIWRSYNCFSLLQLHCSNSLLHSKKEKHVSRILQLSALPKWRRKKLVITSPQLPLCYGVLGLLWFDFIP